MEELITFSDKFETVDNISTFQQRKLSPHFLLELTKIFAKMWHKAVWMGHPIKLELTHEGLLD